MTVATPKIIQQLQVRLRGAGMRSTSARLTVLQALMGSERPQSHSDLMESLEPQGWDRATIHRNLNDLSEAGLLRRFDLGDHVWRYEFRPDGEEEQHPHFVCKECGDVRCLEGVEVRLSPRVDKPAPYGLVTEIQIKGICEDCS